MATTSAPHESLHPHGRVLSGAAAARTEELYARYHRTVAGLCRALLRDRTEAEDAAQQTFLSAHRALLNGSQPTEPAAWLATIARNECWARIRTRMREPLATEQLEAATVANDPVMEAIRRADLEALWAAIAALPRPQRNALLLREFGGLSYTELAEALDVSGSAVESLLFRARRRLQGQLRAAYASLTGASWLEALVRVFVGGGAPVAAKVAALGVGAAAVGSSAVVVPHVLETHSPRTPPPAQRIVHASKPKPVKRAAPVLIEQASATPPPPSALPPAAKPAVVIAPKRVEHDREHETGDDHVAVTAPATPEREAGSDRSGSDDGAPSQPASPTPATPTVSVADTLGIASGDDHGGSDDGVDGSGDSGGHGGDGP